MLDPTPREWPFAYVTEARVAAWWSARVVEDSDGFVAYVDLVADFNAWAGSTVIRNARSLMACAELNHPGVCRGRYRSGDRHTLQQRGLKGVRLRP